MRIASKFLAVTLFVATSNARADVLWDETLNGDLSTTNPTAALGPLEAGYWEITGTLDAGDGGGISDALDPIGISTAGAWSIESIQIVAAGTDGLEIQISGLSVPGVDSTDIAFADSPGPVTYEQSAYLRNGDSWTTGSYDLQIRPNGLVGRVEYTIGINVVPTDFGYAQTTNYQYGHGISLLDLDTNRIASTIVLGERPYTFAMTPNAQYLYVSFWFTSDLAVIDTATNRLVTVMALPGSVGTDVAVTPDGAFVYVASESVITIIDTVTNSIVRTIDTIPYSTSIAFSQDGALAYLGNYIYNAVIVMDTATDGFVTAIPVGRPYGLTVAPDGSAVYVASFADNTVKVIDATTNTVVASVPVGVSTWHVDITPNGQTAYATGRAPQSVSVIATATNTLIGTIPDLFIDRDANVGISPDGDRAYIGEANASTDEGLFIIDTATNVVTDIVPAQQSARYGKVVFMPSEILTDPIERALQIIEDLVSHGDLSRSDANRLISSINNASAVLEKSESVCEELTSMELKIESLVRQGSLSPYDGEMLSNGFSKIWISIGCPMTLAPGNSRDGADLAVVDLSGTAFPLPTGRWDVYPTARVTNLGPVDASGIQVQFLIHSADTKAGRSASETIDFLASGASTWVGPPVDATGDAIINLSPGDYIYSATVVSKKDPFLYNDTMDTPLHLPSN